MAVNFTPTTVAKPIGVQGSYPQREVPGHEGMIADLQAYVCRSYRNQSGAAVPFGAFVQTDTGSASNDPLAVKLAVTHTGIQGLVVSSMVFEGNALADMIYTPIPLPYAADGRMGYPDKETVNVLSKGVVWVYTTAAVDLTDSVRFHKLDNTGTVAGAYIGRFTKTAITGKTVKCDYGARWLSKTGGAGLALLEVDIPACTFTAD